MPFADATRLEPAVDGAFTWDVPDGWQQGRGAWGGLVTGGVVDAVRRHEPDPQRSVRSVSIHMAGPLPVGRATVQVAPVRVGSALSTWSVTVDAGGADAGLVTHGIVVTGRPRAEDLAEAVGGWGTVVRPSLPAWPDVTPVPDDVPGRPTFMRHLEFRVVEGWPLSGGVARCAGYLRFHGQQGWDATSLLAVVDAWHPAVMVALDGMRPLGTVAFAAHLLLDPATVPAGEPLAFESFLTGGHEGFTTEVRRLWTADGRLAVENHQSVVVVR